MKDKIMEAMSKLKNNSITISNTYIFYNMYQIKTVYFGYGIFRLLPQQEQILMKIRKTVLLVKLGLSEKFPRRIIYTKISALGVGLLKLSTIVLFLALHLRYLECFCSPYLKRFLPVPQNLLYYFSSYLMR